MGIEAHMRGEGKNERKGGKVQIEITRGIRINSMERGRDCKGRH